MDQDIAKTIPSHQEHSLSDYALLAREILVCLRGDLSQIDLSKKMGYSFNQVGKWESGVTRFYWRDFIKLNEVLSIDWIKHYTDVFVFYSEPELEDGSVFENLSRYFGYADIDEIAKVLNKSPSVIRRLQHNQVKIDMADILKIMDWRPLVLVSWLAKFLNPSQLPSFCERFERDKEHSRKVLFYPWSILVMGTILLKEYQTLPEHSSEWIASKTGLLLEEVETSIHYLYAEGLLVKRNKHYLSTGASVLLYYLRAPEQRVATEFLLRWILRHMNPEKSFTPNLQNPSLSMTKVYALSSEAGKQIAEACVRFHHELSEIVRKDKRPKDHVRCILLQNIDTSVVTTPQVPNKPYDH